VTGVLPAEEREARVEALGEEEKRLLVATDCLSEGINLQASFDAVVHSAFSRSRSPSSPPFQFQRLRTRDPIRPSCLDAVAAPNPEAR
jgi:hypothetical protein